MAAMIKKLGDIVIRSSLRNDELIFDNPQGINIDKEFMPSVANINGVDLSKYKLVKKGQFACNRMHVGRDGRLPIALNRNGTIIVSPAYDVFEIKDQDEILPEFLMLFFRTNRFDKECWFYTDADIRGALVADSFYNIKIPIPKIETQQHIIKDQAILQEKINNLLILNEQYLKIGAELLIKDLNTKEKNGWAERRLGDFFPIITGKKDANYGDDGGEYPFFTCAKDPIRSPGYSFDSSSLLLAGNGNFDLNWYKGKFEAYQRVYVLTPYKDKLIGFLYFLIRQYKDEITGGAQGSVIQFLTKGMIEGFSLRLPDDDILVKLSAKYNSILDSIMRNKEEIFELQSLKKNHMSKSFNGELA